MEDNRSVKAPQEMTPPKYLAQRVVLLSGAILILVGIFAAVAQLMGELQLFGMNVPAITEPASGRMAELPQQFKVSTHYVGVELVVIGAVLELGALFGFAFSKDPPQSN